MTLQHPLDSLLLFQALGLPWLRKPVIKPNLIKWNINRVIVCSIIADNRCHLEILFRISFYEHLFNLGCNNGPVFLMRFNPHFANAWKSKSLHFDDTFLPSVFHAKIRIAALFTLRNIQGNQLLMDVG